MVFAADVVRYLMSAGGVITIFLAAAVWTFYSKSSRARAALLIVAAGFALASVYGLEFLVSRAIVGSLEPFQADDVVPGRKTALVVLGSGSVEVEDWDGGTYSFMDRSGASRVLEAARVFNLVDPAVVVSSGGSPHNDDPSKPAGDTMRDGLIALGIPADRIIVETQSKTTRDEAMIVKAMLQAQSVEQVILVTSETHMRRALGAFRATGIVAVPAMAKEINRDVSLFNLVMPTEPGLWFAAANAHELLGLGYYTLRGWTR